MNSSYRHRYFDMSRLMFLLGVCLTVYFSFHAIAGHRSLSALRSLDVRLEAAEGALAEVKGEREAVEKRVVMLRGDSLDMDYVEELAVRSLGYVRPESVVVASYRP